MDRLVEALQARRGMIIAEIGAGSGALSVHVARHVAPRGRVFATELNPGLRETIRARAAKTGVENIVVVEADDRSTNLPPDCCDAIFMRHVYHHLSDASAVNGSIKRALRRNGRLVIVECEAWSPLGLLTARLSAEHSIERERLKREVAAAGFEALEFDDWPGSHMYAAVFRDPH